MKKVLSMIMAAAMIMSMTACENEKAPAGTPVFKDPGYGKRKIHYRKTSGNVRITIFEGGHNILSAYGVDWLLKQKKGQKAVWQSAKGSGKAEQLTK